MTATCFGHAVPYFKWYKRQRSADQTTSVDGIVLALWHGVILSYLPTDCQRGWALVAVCFTVVESTGNRLATAFKRFPLSPGLESIEHSYFVESIGIAFVIILAKTLDDEHTIYRPPSWTMIIMIGSSTGSPAIKTQGYFSAIYYKTGILNSGISDKHKAVHWIFLACVGS